MYLTENKSLFLVQPIVFGSTCYILDVRLAVTKLDPKTLKCVFLGYSRIEKGYQYYSPHLDKFLLSIDVAFLKNTLFFLLIV